jgi:hypothetical protein
MAGSHFLVGRFVECRHGGMGLEHLILDLLKTRRGRAVVALLLSAFGAVLWVVAYPGYQDGARLRDSTAVADGEVVETRVSRGQHLESDYDLRYRFRVPGRGEWFTHGERGTGRTDLWSSLNRGDWERARDRGHVAVAYVREDPSINCALAARGRTLNDNRAGLVIGAISLSAGALSLAVISARAVVGDSKVGT